MKLNQLTIIEALRGLKEKKFSAVELTQSCLDRIEEVDHKIKAFITICEKESLEQAKKADKEISAQSRSDSSRKKDHHIFDKKPLLGIPLAIKDNFLVKGQTATAGAKLLQDYQPVYEAEVVNRLKEAGAIILGKTNMDAWAHGSSTETSDFFTTKNPWDLSRLPGGSSGGSAAAVAADQCLGAIGSETAGSIRQPAAWCGITGFKPTYGRVSRYGLIAMASSTDSPGPLTKSVEDAALILKIISGFDPKDATSLNCPPAGIIKNANVIKNLKIGIPKEYFVKGMDQEIMLEIKKQIKLWEKHGAKIVEVNLLDPKYSVAVYTIVQRAEVSSNLARFDGIRFGEKRSSFSLEAKRRIMLGTYTLSAGFIDEYFAKAEKVRELIRQDYKQVFGKVDMLLAATTPTPALKIGAWEKSPMFGELMDILVEASSLAGLPGINLPCGFTKNNLPIGMQLIGPELSEDLLLNCGQYYQQITNWHTRKPKI